jgi:hypothetical protein
LGGEHHGVPLKDRFAPHLQTQGQDRAEAELSHAGSHHIFRARDGRPRSSGPFRAQVASMPGSLTVLSLGVCRLAGFLQRLAISWNRIPPSPPVSPNRFGGRPFWSKRRFVGSALSDSPFCSLCSLPHWN